MYTRCVAPAGDAARTRFRVFSSSPFRAPRAVHDGPRPVHRGLDPLAGDLATGEGIEAAVDGAGTIVHCAGSSKGRRGEDPEPGTGGITGGGDTSGVHLCRRR